MLESQRLFTPAGHDHLLDFLESDHAIEQYLSSSPQYGLVDSDFCWLNHFRVDEVKLEKMAEAPSDYESAVLLYEALPDLNGVFASHGPLWEHFSHFELFNYMKKRWPLIDKTKQGAPKDVEDSISYIKAYWFYSMPMNTWLSSLWWSVYMTVDKKREDPYELTRVLFSQEDLRTRTLGTYLIFRHEPARTAILEFIQGNKESVLKGDFQDKVRYLMKALNLLGGSKQLAYMDKNYFVDYLNRKKDDIVNHYKD